MPLWRASILAYPLVGRPEYDTCRAIDPDWWWRDPMFNLVARAYGAKPPRKRARVKGTPTVGTRSMSVEQLQNALSTHREPS